MLKEVDINICNAIGIKIARSKLNHLNISISWYEICEMFSSWYFQWPQPDNSRPVMIQFVCMISWEFIIIASKSKNIGQFRTMKNWSRLIRIQIGQMVFAYSQKLFIFSHHVIIIMQFLRTTQLISMQI